MTGGLAARNGGWIGLGALVAIFLLGLGRAGAGLRRPGLRGDRQAPGRGERLHGRDGRDAAVEQLLAGAAAVRRGAVQGERRGARTAGAGGAGSGRGAVGSLRACDWAAVRAGTPATQGK